MLSPGSKGWIKKYFHLLDEGSILPETKFPNTAHPDTYFHAVCAKTGIIYGYPGSLLFAQLNEERWTTEEKMKLLLFECLLFAYQTEKGEESLDKEGFISALVEFYGRHSAPSVSKLFLFFLKESPLEKVESILAKRVDIRVNYLENELWVNYLHNVFSYLDVILFKEFVRSGGTKSLVHYEELALNGLNAITLAAYADASIGSAEKSMFTVFLASANLLDEQKNIAEERFRTGTSFQNFTSESFVENRLFKRFLLDLSSFVIFSNHQAQPKEKHFLKELVHYLGLSEAEFHESLLLTEQFIIDHHDRIPFLKNSSSLEKIYSSISKRWIKVLGRNKDKLALELKQSKELVFLIRKSAKTDLTKEEKEMVRTQFMDIVKSMPSLAIFLLPGGAVLLPIVLKIIPDLVPSAFRDNEVEN